MVPLTVEESVKLKESIKDDGQWVPIVCNSEVIIGGHHRYQSCIELGIEPMFITKSFPTKLDEKIFAIEVNVTRRHLDYKGKHVIYTHLKELYEDRAKIKKIKDGKKYGENHPKPNKSSKREETSSEKAAKIAGLSAMTARRMDHVKQHNPDSYDKIGTNNMTPDKAYREPKAAEKKAEIQKEMNKKKIRLPEIITPYNKRFQDANIPENSVDLIITDLPYLENDISPKNRNSIFRDLGDHAMKVLRDGGVLVTITGHFYLDVAIDHLKSSGLTYHWILCILHSGKSVVVHSKKALVGWKPMLMLVKGNYNGDYFPDLIRSEYQGKKTHEWAQSTKEATHCINYLTNKGDIIYDPCMGQGTFGVSAKKMARRFLGCEIVVPFYKL